MDKRDGVRVVEGGRDGRWIRGMEWRVIEGGRDGRCIRGMEWRVIEGGRDGWVDKRDGVESDRGRKRW